MIIKSPYIADYAINGETQFTIFLNDRLINRTTVIDAPIKKNNYELPGNINEKLKLQENKLKYPIATLSKLREAVHLRKDKATELFSTELFGVSQCIAENSNSLYHGTKSDILKRFATCNYIEPHKTKTTSAMVFDLSLFTKSHVINKKDTFYTFAESLI